MLTRKIFPALIGALLLSAFPRGWAATDKSALERIDPVPAGEPIPLVDFFRPALLRAPALNPAGTHVAALITASEDRYSLMVYNLEKKTMETIHGAGDKDVYSFVWLDNKRLISTLAQEKLWGLGLFASEADWLSKTYPLLQFTGVRLVSVPRKDRTHPLVWVGQGLENGADDIGVARINAAMDLGPMLNLSTPGNNSGEGFNKVRENNRRHIVSSYPRPKDGVGSGYYIADKDGELAYCVTGRDGNRDRSLAGKIPALKSRSPCGPRGADRSVA